MTQFNVIFTHVQKWLHSRVNVAQVHFTMINILNDFRKENSVLTVKSIDLSERNVEEANKSVSKALECKREAAGCKHKAIQHSDEMRPKVGEVCCCPRSSSSAETSQERAR